MGSEQGFQVGKTYRVKPECYDDFRFVGWWTRRDIRQSSTFEVHKLEGGTVIDTNGSGYYIATASEFKYCELVTTEKETNVKKVNEFKVGDAVYLPSSDTKVHVVTAFPSDKYPLRINGDAYTTGGKYVVSAVSTSLFHATKENHALLEALYGVEFEKPVLEGDDLTIELLKKGKPVLCYIYDALLRKDTSHLRMVSGYSELAGFKTVLATWKHATPVPLSEIGNV